MRLSHRQDVLQTFHRLEKKSQKRFCRRHVLASNPCRAMGVVVVEIVVSQLLVITW